MSLNIRSSRQPATIINIHSPTNTSGSDSEYIQSNSSRQPPSTSVKVSPKVEECRKVIQLITGKLLKRKTPPTCLFYLPDLSLHTQSVDQFDNEDTVELLMQLRTALIMCITIGLSEENSKSAEMLSPSVQYTGPKTDKQPDLIKILQILSDLIMNDSRYKSANPKPTRPPYIMQTTLIDIAYILVQIAKDPADLYQVGTVYLPGFEAFPKEALVGKLMSFYVDALLPKLMKCKEESKPKIPEMKAAQPSVSTRASKKNPNTPTINIHSPEPEETNNPAKVSNLTIDTSYFPADVNSQYLAYSPTSPNVNTTTNTKSNDTFAYALFTPLLYFMIQYLDPYLTSAPKASGTDTLSHTLTQQASSIHNFHRGLSYMMTCKPDLYLDILDVISNSTSDVKLRACQILFHYYFMSVGHVIVTRPLPKLGVKEELVALEDYRYQEEREERKQYGRFGSNDTSGKFPKIDILDNDPIDNHHIWYPHMFPNSQKKQSDTTEYHLNTTNARPIIVQSGINDADCIKCHTSIKGYGLRCYQCKGNSHYNCSNSSGLSEDRVMIYHKPGGIQRMVLPHFCVISPQPRFVDVVEKGIAGWTMKSNAAKVGLLGHSFQLVNSFTLMICMCCGLPLWGPFHQGYCCSSCNQFIHPQCLLRAEENSFTSKEQFSSLEKCKSQKPLQAKDIQISYTKLYASFYEYYGDFLPRELEDLEGKGFEETSEILNVLLIQENIIRYGIAAGTITILQYNPLSPSSIAQDLPFPMTGSSNETNGISSILGTAIELCSEYLRSGKCRASTYLSEFFSNKHSNIDDCLLSKESYLSHLSAMMKSLTVSSSTFGSLVQSFVTTPGSAASPIAHPFDKRKSAGDSRGFLQVLPNSLRSPKYEWNSFENHFADEQTPHDTLNRSALLSWIMANLNFKNRKLGEILLQHMQNMGLFERFDASPILFHMDSSDNHYPESKLIQCIFPVPYAIDNSFNVEALIGAIDSCLTDVNISVNECGFLLLIHRCWPDPFLSSYTSERLIYIILKWILDEDERLLLLHSELIANKNTELGGNRLQTKWAQPAFISKMMGAGGDRSRQSAMFYNVGTGISEGGSGDYVLVRSMLKERYLMNWLATIQEIDKEAYGNMLFKAIEDIIDDKREECVVPDWSETSNDKRYITQKYEQFISNIYKLRKYGEDQPMELRHLAKLCASKSPQSKAVNLTHSELAQPMDIITSQFSTGEKASLDRGFRWLTLVTHAGTALPLNSLEQISQMLINNQSSLGILAQFLKIVWFQTVNIVSQQTSGLNVLNILEKLNKYAQVKLKDLNESEKISNESMINTQMFVKYCIALSCYYYCCPLKKIISLGIVPYPGEHALNIS
ncbi:hypothetical protein BDB01DRAFT_716190 [Pilobolus umbonatus]|nr:hypothetical protein BDB01DRAFT_716190 [Pilobolus umbonatus]